MIKGQFLLAYLYFCFLLNCKFSSVLYKFSIFIMASFDEEVVELPLLFASRISYLNLNYKKNLSIHEI